MNTTTLDHGTETLATNIARKREEKRSSITAPRSADGIGWRILRGHGSTNRRWNNERKKTVYEKKRNPSKRNCLGRVVGIPAIFISILCGIKKQKKKKRNANKTDRRTPIYYPLEDIIERRQKTQNRGEQIIPVLFI